MLRTSTIALFFVAGCTDAEFYFPVDPDSPDMRVALSAEVCAPAPLIEDAPYKILFVVDTSLSNIFSDVAENRVAAYDNAIAQFSGSTNVSFALITFNDQPHLPVLAFTRNTEILDAISENLTNEFAEGGTNYADTLASIYSFINNDISSTLVSNEAPLVPKTHYIVYWLSDGLPTFGVSDPVALAANAQTIHDYLTPKVAEFRLDTMYMQPPLSMDIGNRHWEITPAEIADAQALLELMATRGGGNFTPIATGQSFDFDIELEQQSRTFELASAIAFDRHTRLLTEMPEADTDGDGVTDREEKLQDLDLFNPDTDGDGFRDAVELIASHRLRALTPDAGCEAGELDTDEDGLRDCEELVLGTDPANADTDGDEVPDELEVLLGSSPVSADRAVDQDLDGVPDRSEVAFHLDAKSFDTPEQQARWRYGYELVPRMGRGEGQACYQIEVSNISMAETLGLDGRPNGGQVVDLVVTFKTPDKWATERIYRSRTRVVYRWPDFREPTNGKIELTNADFYELPVFDIHGELLLAGHRVQEVEDEPLTTTSTDLGVAPPGGTPSGSSTGDPAAIDNSVGPVEINGGGCAAANPRAPAGLLLSLLGVALRRRCARAV